MTLDRFDMSDDAPESEAEAVATFVSSLDTSHLHLLGEAVQSELTLRAEGKPPVDTPLGKGSKASRSWRFRGQRKSELPSGTLSEHLGHAEGDTTSQLAGPRRSAKLARNAQGSDSGTSRRLFLRAPP